jgi:hypothetical protein
MRYQYVVILKRNSDRVIDRISILLCCLSGAAFILAQMQTQHFNYFLSLAAILVLAGPWLVFFSARTTKVRTAPMEQVNAPPGHSTRPRYKYWLLAAAIGWLAMPALTWLSALFILLAFLEYQAKYPLEIGFSPDRIVINSLIRKKFGWAAFSNIILKDGLLTMDFKNNRLLQKEVDEEEEGDADEDEFNDYCRERLGAVGGGT